jgi:hypothetical protein
MIGKLKLGARLCADACPLKPNVVQASDGRVVTGYEAVGGDVTAHHRVSGDKGEGANLNKLVHRRVTPKAHPLTHHHVPREAHLVGEHTPCAELCVMSDVAVGHQEATLPNPCHALS